jgi:hypothetical protein
MTAIKARRNAVQARDERLSTRQALVISLHGACRVRNETCTSLVGVYGVWSSNDRDGPDEVA